MSFMRGWSAHCESQRLNTLSRWASEMARFLSVLLAILTNMCSVRKVHRTARIALRTTLAQRRRCYGLLRSAGDLWAWVLDCNRRLREQHRPQVAAFSALCRELTGTSFEGAVAALRRGGPEELLHRMLRGGQAPGGWCPCRLPPPQAGPGPGALPQGILCHRRFPY